MKEVLKPLLNKFIKYITSTIVSNIVKETDDTLWQARKAIKNGDVAALTKQADCLLKQGKKIIEDQKTKVEVKDYLKKKRKSYLKNLLKS